MVVKIKSNLRHMQEVCSFAKIEEESILVIVWLFDFPKRFQIFESLSWKRHLFRTKSQKNNHKLTWLLSLPYFDFCVAALYSSFLSIPTIATTWLKTEREEKNGYVTDSWSGLSIEMTLAGIHRYSTRKRNTILTRSPWGESWHKIYT